MDELAKAKPGVPIEIGGEPRVLVFDWWAFSLIEEDRGEEFLNTLKLTPRNLMFLTWAGLVHTMPELDGETPKARRAAQKRVAQMCGSNTDYKKLANAVLRALTNSVPGGTATKNEQAETETIA